MSFSSDVKMELAGNVPGARHCQIAELAAMISMVAYVILGRQTGRAGDSYREKCYRKGDSFPDKEAVQIYSGLKCKKDRS